MTPTDRGEPPILDGGKVGRRAWHNLSGMACRYLAVPHSELTDPACPFRQRGVDKRSRLIAKDRAD